MQEKIKIVHEMIRKYGKGGVKSIEIDGIRIEFEPLPKKQRQSKKDEEIQTDKLSEEELLFWSSNQEL